MKAVYIGILALLCAWAIPGEASSSCTGDVCGIDFTYRAASKEMLQRLGDDYVAILDDGTIAELDECYEFAEDVIIVLHKSLVDVPKPQAKKSGNAIEVYYTKEQKEYYSSLGL